MTNLLNLTHTTAAARISLTERGFLPPGTRWQFWDPAPRMGGTPGPGARPGSIRMGPCAGTRRCGGAAAMLGFPGEQFRQRLVIGPPVADDLHPPRN